MKNGRILCKAIGACQLLVALFCFQASAAAAAAQVTTIRVNSGSDNNLHDDAVETFHEAILISEGKLKPTDLTPQERKQVHTKPAVFDHQNIFLLVDVKVDSALPDISAMTP